MDEWQTQVEKWVDNDLLREGSIQASEFLHQKILEGGEEIREAVDVLHGKQLGHPLHPVLINLTLGSWTLGVFFDVLALVTRSRSLNKSADALIKVGTISAVPTALTGLADYSGIKKDSASYGGAHGLLNSAAFFCFVSSTAARSKGNRGTALFFACVGLMLVTVSGWLGGEMVYRRRVGVNHAEGKDLPEWVEVIPDADLKENELVRVEADGQPILLYRSGDKVYAIDAVCSHAGGPLEEGKIVNEVCVECPWHQSVYDLRDGHVVHGPSTYNQRAYAVRLRNSQLEVKQIDPDDLAQPSNGQQTESLYDTPASEPELVYSDAKRDQVDDLPSQAEGERE